MVFYTTIAGRDMVSAKWVFIDQHCSGNSISFSVEVNLNLTLSASWGGRDEDRLRIYFILLVSWKLFVRYLKT